MIDSVRDAGQARQAAVRSAGAATASPPSPLAAQARQIIDASRQGGVVNPGELARELGVAMARQPESAAAPAWASTSLARWAP